MSIVILKDLNIPEVITIKRENRNVMNVFKKVYFFLSNIILAQN